jgi:uncharacterized protein (TIGR02246 family)
VTTTTVDTAPQAAPSDGVPVAVLYAEVQQFYAGHFHLLDGGDAAGWVRTFTPDGSFWPAVLPEPVRGRDALLAGVEATYRKLAEAGERHRHWHGMVHVEPIDRDTLMVRCYATVYVIPRGGSARLHLHCLCRDVLVRQDGQWRIHARVVTRDDMPDADLPDPEPPGPDRH